jgi:hypothetical protein
MRLFRKDGRKEERALKGRGIKFYLFIRPRVAGQPKFFGKENKIEYWQSFLVGRLPFYFEREGSIIEPYSSMTSFLWSGKDREEAEAKLKKEATKNVQAQQMLDMMVIKVNLPIAKFVLKPSEAGNFYSKLIEAYIIDISESLAKINFWLTGYRFDLVFRMMPPEKPNEFISMDTTIPDSEIVFDSTTGLWRKKDS